MKHKHYTRLLGFSLLSALLFSCTHVKDTTNSRMKTNDIVTETGTRIISVPVVAKSFVKKNGEVADFTEMYIERSIQDYFIKFCESKVTRSELEKYISAQGGDFNMATLEVEFRNGSWDICDGNTYQQSRIGEYVVIHRIVEE